MTVNEESNLRGIAFMLLAMTVFSFQDVLSKQLATYHSPFFIAMWRYWAFGVVCLVLLWRTGFSRGMRSGQPFLQIVRSIGLALEICIAILSFHLLGLAGTTAIFAFGPLLVVALSGPLLGEHVGWRRWSAIGVGFLGMLLIIRPGSQTLSLGLGMAILAMVMFALYGLATRRVAETDAAMTSFYYTGVFGAVIMTLIGPWFWSVMTPFEMLLMAMLCVSGMVGHFTLIKALEAAEASSLQPFAYFQTIFSMTLGVVIFHEIVPASTIAGGAIVIGAGLFTFWRERVRARQAAKAPPALIDRN